MNLFLIIGISFVVLYLLLNFFAKASSKKIAKGIRYIIFSVGILLAITLFLLGRYAFSIPILLFLVPLIKLKGIGGLFQLFQLWRLINYLRQTGRYSFTSGANYSKASSSMKLDDAYKILDCKKGCSKSEVLSKYKKIMSKLHPDKNNDTDTTKLAQMVSEAKETILKDLS
jgi:fatty acid desaturase|tara:strand:- start:4676 stop:5188 length:513 start_codon:yes stop_codon:yes gene_type:complete